MYKLLCMCGVRRLIIFDALRRSAADLVLHAALISRRGRVKEKKTRMKCALSGINTGIEKNT